MCLLLLLPPKSSKSGADGFSINVHSLTPPYPFKKKVSQEVIGLRTHKVTSFFACSMVAFSICLCLFLYIKSE